MNRHPALQGAIDVLEQGKTLLEGVDDRMYATVVGKPFGASIGQHYRHVLDHFRCLLDAIDTGLVNYDHRSRSREIECDREHAIAETQRLLAVLTEMNFFSWQGRCAVTYSVNFRDADASWVNSTYERELAFSAGHAVHHYAIIRLLCAAWNVEMPVEFGVAPSTLKHRAAQAVNG